MSRRQGGMLTDNAKLLRRNMTDQERHLWYDFLRELPVAVKRQKVIGPYIVDFYIASAKLVIELDGSQHYEDAGKEADGRRDEYLQGQGLTVLRYSNLEVDRFFDGVCEDIMSHISPSLPLEGKAFSVPADDSVRCGVPG